MRSVVYQLTNVVAAAVWAGGIGVGSYLAGPAVIDFVNDFGTGTAVILAVVIVVGGGRWSSRAATGCAAVPQR